VSDGRDSEGSQHVGGTRLFIDVVERVAAPRSGELYRRDVERQKKQSNTFSFDADDRTTDTFLWDRHLAAGSS